MSFALTAILISWLAILLLAFAMSGLLRQVYLLSSRQAIGVATLGPSIGSVVPWHSEWSARRDRRVGVLLFMDSNCGVCTDLLPEVERIAASSPDADFLVLYRGSENGSPISSSASVRRVEDQESAFAQFGIGATPFGVAVDQATQTVIATSPLGSVARLQRFSSEATKEVSA